MINLANYLEIAPKIAADKPELSYNNARHAARIASALAKL